MLLITLMREPVLMLIIRRHFAILLKDGFLLVHVMFSKLVAGLRFSVLTVHGYKGF